MNRQHFRQQDRQLRKAADRVLRLGLAEDAEPESVLGLASRLSRILKQTANPSRATEAAALVHTVFDTSVRKSEHGIKLACGKGCAYCCHTYVSVLAPEVFRIASVIRTGAARRVSHETFEARAAETANKGHDARHGKQLPCALLVDGLCSVYQHRPMMCRKAASTAVDDCIATFNGSGKGWTMPRINDTASRASLYALSIALLINNLPWQTLELSAALQVALRHDDAETAWLAGDNIFAGVSGDPIPPGYEQQLRHDAGLITH
jgi:Fe-S-cluster containining protein